MKSLSVARSTLALSLAVALLSAASWVGEAQGVERARKTVVYGSGFQLASVHLVRTYVDSTAVADETNMVSDDTGMVGNGDCASCGTGTGYRGCRYGCCMNVWDGYCEERRGACGWGSGTRRCRSCCGTSSCDSCGCDAEADSGTVIDSGSTPTAQPETAKPAAPKPALDRSAFLRRAR